MWRDFWWECQRAQPLWKTFSMQPSRSPVGCIVYPREWKTAVQKKNLGASLVAQWLRICLLMQGTRVRALVWEDPTCRGATRPVSHNY